MAAGSLFERLVPVVVEVRSMLLTETCFNSGHAPSQVRATLYVNLFFDGLEVAFDAPIGVDDADLNVVTCTKARLVKQRLVLGKGAVPSSSAPTRARPVDCAAPGSRRNPVHA